MKAGFTFLFLVVLGTVPLWMDNAYLLHIFIITGIFIIAAIITPPDVVSQLMLLVPLYMLYELAIVAIRLTHWRAARAARASEKKENAEPQTNVGPDSPPGGGRVGESGPI